MCADTPGPRSDASADHNWFDVDKIFRISDAVMTISPDTPWDAILDILCEKTAALVDADAATCRTYDPRTKTMFAGGSFNWHVERASPFPPENTVAGQVLSSDEHVHVRDIDAEPLYHDKDKAREMGMRSLLALPMKLVEHDGSTEQDVLVGTLQLYFAGRHDDFHRLQIRMLRSLIYRFSYLLAQKRRIELAKRSRIIKESHKQLLSILQRTRSVDQVLSFLVGKIAELIGVNRCSLFSIERNAAGHEFAVLIAGFPLMPRAHTYGITLSFGDHPAFAEVCHSGTMLMIENAREDPRMRRNYELYIDRHIQNVCFVPIKDDCGTVTHMLVLDGEESKPLTTEDRYFLEAILDDIELCIHTSIHSQQRHDFLNQMVSFGAIAKVLAKKQASPETTAEERDRLLKKLSQSMLAIQDIISDHQPLAERETFSLNTAIAERLNAYYVDSGITVTDNLAGQQLHITADRKKVGRIIGNLIDNACKKLSELKSGTLSVHLSAEGPYAVVTIGNTGVIPPETRALLAAGIAPPDQRRETGMGLSIVRLFTVMHNGVFEYESSDEHNWTVFRIKLPFQPE